MQATETNIAIAELLGWTDCEIMKLTEGQYPFGTAPDGSILELPNYSESLDACAELIEAMRKEGWRVAIEARPKGIWICQFWKTLADFSNTGQSDSLPLAICESFLRLHSKWRE